MSHPAPTVSAASVDAALATPPPGEGCPTPLAWEQVLTVFRAERDEFRLDTSWGPVDLWEFGRGEPLVVIGSEAGDAELFALLAYLLRDERRMVFVQLPDAPISVPPQAHLAGWAHLVGEALTARGIHKFPLLGCGWGGRVALQFAVDVPERITGLILQGAVADKPWRWTERLAFRAAAFTRRPLGRLPGWSKVAEANHRPWFPPFDAGRWEFLRTNLAETSARTFVQRQCAALTESTLARLPKLVCPVQWIRTEGEGRATTQANDDLLSQIPNVAIETLHSAGLFPHVTHTHRLAKPIREFLARAPQAALDSSVSDSQ
jgi:pimeloyl-ACP methyl ester carboxylesterase